MLFTKELPIRYDVDILVVGGGPSGVAAAGDAAVLAAESQDVRRVNISELQNEIVKSGGIVQNRNK